MDNMDNMDALKTSFELKPADWVDPASLPFHILPGGQRLPGIGIGTFGNDRYSPWEIAESVLGALSVGYRFVDGASVYGNEKEVGAAIQTAIRGGIPREELFISSKLWNDRHQPGDVIPSLRQSLADLGLNYLDAYYIHWPFRNSHAIGATGDSREEGARPYSHAEYMETYREFEKAYDQGLIRHIGVSNMTMKKLGPVLSDARIRPALNQLEMHPAFAQTEFFHYLRRHWIVPMAFCPLGSPGRPERDTTPEDVNVLTHPVMVEIGKRHGEHPALICLKWAVQRGQVPMPSSIRRQNYRANLLAAAHPDLSQAEMAAIAAIDCGSRLIKGQVFLWPGAESWRDLWDGE